MADNPFFYVALFACLVVVGVLLVGVGAFAKGGEFNRKYANKIMRLRLLTQFIAVLIILAVVYFSSGG
ncbi:MAG: twin transmembrane helix small protein [Pseudomonadota bacterium]